MNDQPCMSTGHYRSTPRSLNFYVYKFYDVQAVGQDLRKAASLTQGDSSSPLKFSTAANTQDQIFRTCPNNAFLHQIYSCFYLQLLPKLRSEVSWADCVEGMVS